MKLVFGNTNLNTTKTHLIQLKCHLIPFYLHLNSYKCNRMKTPEFAVFGVLTF